MIHLDLHFRPRDRPDVTLRRMRRDTLSHAQTVKFLGYFVKEELHLDESQEQSDFEDLHVQEIRRQLIRDLKEKNLTANRWPKQLRKPNENGIHGPALALNDPSGDIHLSGRNSAQSSSSQ